MRWIISFLIAMVPSPQAMAQDAVLKTKLAIDGQGNAIRDAVIIVRDGKIASIQPNGRVPSGAREVDLTRFTVMPGMIDMHVHIAAHFDETSRERPSITAFWAAASARQYLERVHHASVSAHRILSTSMSAMP